MVPLKSGPLDFFVPGRPLYGSPKCCPGRRRSGLLHGPPLKLALALLSSCPAGRRKIGRPCFAINPRPLADCRLPRFFLKSLGPIRSSQRPIQFRIFWAGKPVPRFVGEGLLQEYGSSLAGISWLLRAIFGFGNFLPSCLRLFLRAYSPKPALGPNLERLGSR